jgi:hypothetical protein
MAASWYPVKFHPSQVERGSQASARRCGRYRPQFHIGPIGVCVQHGPKPPPFQRLR